MERNSKKYLMYSNGYRIFLHFTLIFVTLRLSKFGIPPWLKSELLELGLIPKHDPCTEINICGTLPLFPTHNQFVCYNKQKARTSINFFPEHSSMVMYTESSQIIFVQNVKYFTTAILCLMQERTPCRQISSLLFFLFDLPTLSYVSHGRSSSNCLGKPWQE